MGIKIGFVAVQWVGGGLDLAVHVDIGSTWCHIQPVRGSPTIFLQGHWPPIAQSAS